MEFINEWFWFFLLLPIAAVSGWLIGRRGGERHSDSQVSRLSTTYFRGLNYLLNEQPDKAIEVFLHIAELDKDTFETQVALGHLFRRRGEVDRAIRLHQALVQRPDLSDQQKVQALLALGEDYMRSGLLDRAETVFSDLVRARHARPQALKHLIGIYQSERDWDKAIENARALRSRHRRADGQADRAVRMRSSPTAIAPRAKSTPRAHAVARAYEADANSVRAGIIEGRIELDAGNDAGAIRAFERVARNDPDYLPEILPPLLACYERVGDGPGARSFLAEMMRALPRRRPGAGADPDGRSGGGRVRGARVSRAAIEGSPVGARRSGADRPDPGRGGRSAGDPARPQAHHRPVAGAQSELSLHPLRLRRAQRTTGSARAARSGARSSRC